MSYTKRVLQAMKFDMEYDSTTLAAITHIDKDSVASVLHLLEKGKVIELTKPDRFRKNRKYKSNQRQLF